MAACLAEPGQLKVPDILPPWASMGANTISGGPAIVDEGRRLEAGLEYSAGDWNGSGAISCSEILMQEFGKEGTLACLAEPVPGKAVATFS